MTKKTWKWSFAVLLVAIAVLGWAYTTSVRKNSDRKVEKISENTSTRVHFWYAEIQGCHLIFQTYWPDANIQDYTARQLDNMLSMRGVYCKLRITSFQKPAITFVEARDTLSFSLKSGLEVCNMPISPAVECAPQENRLWLRTMCKANLSPWEKYGAILSVLSSGSTAALAPEIRKEVAIRKYLIAFSAPIELGDIQEVSLVWKGKKYLLAAKTCLRKDFDEYLRDPTPAFWRQPGA